MATEDASPPSVLIADGNVGRGRRLADACEVAGIPCEAVRDGAACLDRALSEKPVLVVAELDLPLVDAEKLSEILRVNPRTRSVRFLFLGKRSTQPSPGRVGDVLLPVTSRPNDLVRAIEEMLLKQDRIDAVDAASAKGGQVEGELTQLTLAELLERFHVGAKSGRLALSREVDGDQVATAEILVREGEVIHAEVGSIENEKAVFRLLAWPAGRFVFEPGPQNQPAAIRTSTRLLLSEGLRQLAEWDRLALQLPSSDSRADLRVKRSELPHSVHPLTGEVLSLLESYRIVSEIVDRCSFPDYQVLRSLHTLAQREIIELGRAPSPEEALDSGEGESVLLEGQGRRLFDWLQGGSPLGLVARNAKLLVVSSEPDALHDFLRLIEPIAGVQMTGARASNDPSVLARDLAVIGRIQVDDELGIELLHVPLDARFSPLWPLLGHGALGTLFLLSGSVSAAAERVRAMSDALRERPHARIFHVIQFRKDECISPDDLRDNLSLIDEASLFLLPLESGKAPAVLLRRLLSRVIS